MEEVTSGAAMPVPTEEGPELSAAQIAAIKAVLTTAKEKLRKWADLSQEQRSSEVVKAVLLCRIITTSPNALTDEDRKKAETVSLLLQRVINERFCASAAETEQFWTRTIPFTLDCALECADEINQTMSDRLVQMKAEGSKVVTKSRWECAVILAGGFFCVFSPDDANGQRPNYDFMCVHRLNPTPCSFVLCYFSQVAKEPVDELKSEKISFTRKAVAPTTDLTAQFAGSAIALCDVKYDPTGTIEDYQCLQADFANQYIGGGVLLGGNVQEEIRFMICPELIASMPLCDMMLPHEAIEIVGAIQYANYLGYGGSLQYNGPTDLAAEKSKHPLDDAKRRTVRIVAFDALPMPERRVQYGHRGMARELVKATAAFSLNPADTLPTGAVVGEARLGVATGNWGCGVFGGDPQLKCLLQWMACSVAERPHMVYCAFNDKRVEQMPAVVKAIQDAGMTVGDLYKLLYSEAFQTVQPWRTGVFNFVMSQLTPA